MKLVGAIKETKNGWKMNRKSNQGAALMYVVPFLCCLCMLSCHSRQNRVQQETAESFDTIYVSYHKGVYETSVRTPCSLVKKWSESEDVSEVIVIDKRDYDAIFSYLSENADKGNDSTTCEARIYVQAAENEICINDVIVCACDVNEKDIPANDYALYLIRSLSGYYNYLDSLDLQFDRLIEKFGMPSCYQNKTIKDINWDDDAYYDDFRKVALVRAG